MPSAPDTSPLSGEIQPLCPIQSQLVHNLVLPPPLPLSPPLFYHFLQLCDSKGSTLAVVVELFSLIQSTSFSPSQKSQLFKRAHHHRIRQIRSSASFFIPFSTCCARVDRARSVRLVARQSLEFMPNRHLPFHGLDPSRATRLKTSCPVRSQILLHKNGLHRPRPLVVRPPTRWLPRHLPHPFPLHQREPSRNRSFRSSTLLLHPRARCQKMRFATFSKSHEKIMPRVTSQAYSCIATALLSSSSRGRKNKSRPCSTG